MAAGTRPSVNTTVPRTTSNRRSDTYLLSKRRRSVSVSHTSPDLLDGPLSRANRQDSPDPLLLDDSGSHPSISNTPTPVLPRAITTRESRSIPSTPAASERPTAKQARLRVEIPTGRKAEPAAGGGEGSSKGKKGGGLARSTSLSSGLAKQPARRSARHSLATQSVVDSPSIAPVNEPILPSSSKSELPLAEPIAAPAPTPVTPSDPPVVAKWQRSPDSADGPPAQVARDSPSPPPRSSQQLQVLSPDTEAEEAIDTALVASPSPPARPIPPPGNPTQQLRFLSPDLDEETPPAQSPLSLAQPLSAVQATSFPSRILSPDSDEPVVRLATPPSAASAHPPSRWVPRAVSPDTEDESPEHASAFLPGQAYAIPTPKSLRVLSPDSDEEDPGPTVAPVPQHIPTSQPASTPLTPSSPQPDLTTPAEPSHELCVETEATPPPALPQLLPTSAPATELGHAKGSEESRIANTPPNPSVSDLPPGSTSPVPSSSPDVFGADNTGAQFPLFEDFHPALPAAAPTPEAEPAAVFEVAEEVDIERSIPLNNHQDSLDPAPTATDPIVHPSIPTPETPEKNTTSTSDLAPLPDQSLSPSVPSTSTTIAGRPPTLSTKSASFEILIPTTGKRSSLSTSPKTSTSHSFFAVEIDASIPPKPRASLSSPEVALPPKPITPPQRRVSTRARAAPSRYAPTRAPFPLPPTDPVADEMAKRSSRRIQSPESTPASRAPTPGASAPPAPPPRDAATPKTGGGRRRGLSISTTDSLTPPPSLPRSQPQPKADSLEPTIHAIVETKSSGKAGVALRLNAPSAPPAKKSRASGTAAVPLPVPAPAVGKGTRSRRGAASLEELEAAADVLPRKRKLSAAEKQEAKRAKKEESIKRAADFTSSEEDEQSPAATPAPQAPSGSTRDGKRKRASGAPAKEEQEPKEAAAEKEKAAPRIVLKINKQPSVAGSEAGRSGTPKESPTLIPSAVPWGTKRPSPTKEAGEVSAAPGAVGGGVVERAAESDERRQRRRTGESSKRLVTKELEQPEQASANQTAVERMAAGASTEMQPSTENPPPLAMADVEMADASAPAADAAPSADLPAAPADQPVPADIPAPPPALQSTPPAAPAPVSTPPGPPILTPPIQTPATRKKDEPRTFTPGTTIRLAKNRIISVSPQPESAATSERHPTPPPAERIPTPPLPAEFTPLPAFAASSSGAAAAAPAAETAPIAVAQPTPLPIPHQDPTPPPAAEKATAPTPPHSTGNATAPTPPSLSALFEEDVLPFPPVLESEPAQVGMRDRKAEAEGRGESRREEKARWEERPRAEKGKRSERSKEPEKPEDAGMRRKEMGKRREGSADPERDESGEKSRKDAIEAGPKKTAVGSFKKKAGVETKARPPKETAEAVSSTPKTKDKPKGPGTAPSSSHSTPAGTPTIPSSSSVKSSKAAAAGGDSAAGTPVPTTSGRPKQKGTPANAAGAGGPIRPKPAPVAALKARPSMLESTLAALKGRSGTPAKNEDPRQSKKDKEKVEAKPASRGYSFVWVPTAEQDAEWQASAPERLAARARREAQAKNGLNLNFARDTYKRDSMTDYYKDVPIPGATGIHTSGKPEQILRYLFGNVTHAERRQKQEEVKEKTRLEVEAEAGEVIRAATGARGMEVDS